MLNGFILINILLIWCEYIECLQCYACGPSESCELAFNVHMARAERARLLTACPTGTVGCFKRWVDVQPKLTQRGCRFRKPRPMKSNDSSDLPDIDVHDRRFADVERMFRPMERDGCRHSRMRQKLTVGRRTALGVYAMCVCDKERCNSSPHHHNTLSVVITLALLYLLNRSV